jgi:hypothetical protein
MKVFRRLSLVFLFAGSGAVLAQAPQVVPEVLNRLDLAGKVTAVEVAPRFVTTIRLPETVSSIVVGDPAVFQVEHSDREPKLVFVKALTTKATETNLLVSMSDGHEVSLLLVNRGENPTAQGRRVAFLVTYQRTTGFLVASTALPFAFVGETVPVDRNADDHSTGSHGWAPISNRAGNLAAGSEVSAPINTTQASSAESLSLDEFLKQQEDAKLPPLYGEHISEESQRGDSVRAGVSRVLDQGQQVIALFSIVNPSRHAVLLMPPQVQLGGHLTSGKLVQHSHWSVAEQLPVLDFRLSRRRLGPGERADGVVLFERPPYKQSNETLLLQVAEAGAVDRPALAPIGFGVSTLPEDRNGQGN